MSGFTYPFLYVGESTPPGKTIICDSAFLSLQKIKEKIIKADKSKKSADIFESERLVVIDIFYIEGDFKHEVVRRVKSKGLGGII